MTQTVGVTRLTLTDFRNSAFLRLDLDLRPVVLTGENGSGKTNLLEAVSFLAPGRGLRRAKLSTITRQGAAEGLLSPWSVAASVLTPDGQVDLGTGRAAGESDKRLVRIDGRPAKTQSELGKYLSFVWLTPAMDRLFSEPASARRRFLDRLVYGIDNDHATRLTHFDHACRQRSRLLRDGVNDRTWLSTLEDTIASEGVAIAAARRSLVALLSAALAEAEGPFPHAQVALHGFVESWLDDSPARAVEDRYRAHLEQSRGKEQAGAPTDGPHRSDLAVFHHEKAMPAAQCSTGEQKAVLIALILAQARVQLAARGVPPVLLFDEVIAHLDARRRSALFDILSALPAQAWLTGTEAEPFTSLADRAQFFTIRLDALNQCQAERCGA